MKDTKVDSPIPDASASTLPPSDEVVALLKEISKSLKSQNERLARLEARENLRRQRREGDLQSIPEDAALSEGDNVGPLGLSTSRLVGGLNDGNYNREDLIALIKQDLQEFGSTEQEIQNSLLNLKAPFGGDLPTYTRISRKYISPETLDRYLLPWEIDSDPSFVVIKRWVAEPEQDILFNHTRMIRKGRALSFTDPYDESTATLDGPSLPNTIKVRYLSEVVPSIEGEPLSKGFLQAPADHRIMTGFLGGSTVPAHTTLEFRDMRKAWLSKQKSTVHPDGTKPDLLRELMDFMRSVERSSARVFIRDSDLHLNNRLYSLGEIIEYRNGEDPFSPSKSRPPTMVEDVKRFPETSGIQICPVIWHVKDDELQINPLPQPYFAPWIRTILLEGIASLVPKATEIKSASLPFIFGDEHTIHQHLEGGSIAWFKWPPKRAVVNIQLSWFKVVPVRTHEMNGRLQDDLHPDSLTWKSGYLYGSQTRILKEQVWTLKTVYRSADDPSPSDSHLGGERYWTSLILTPPGFYTKRQRNKCHFFNDYVLELPVFIFNRILEAVDALTTDWNVVLDYAEILMVDIDSVFSPEYHDALLLDDAKFERSRALSWILDATYMFENSISGATDVYIGFLREICDPLRDDNERRNIRTPGRERIETASLILDQFTKLQNRVIVMRSRALELRVGLATASTAVEGRATGQNVVRLTYISAFYAPLIFCAFLAPLVSTPLLYFIAVPICLATYLAIFKIGVLIDWLDLVRFKISTKFKKDGDMDEDADDNLVPPRRGMKGHYFDLESESEDFEKEEKTKEMSEDTDEDEIGAGEGKRVSVSRPRDMETDGNITAKNQ